MIWFARVLCEVPAGHFSAPQREEYFRWFDETAPQLKGGNNFVKFLEAIRQRALTQLPESLRGQVEKNHQIALAKLTELRTSTPQGVPERKFVRAWTVADLEPDFGKVKAGRNFARAKEIFASQLCLRCHRMGQEGGGVGPDLTAVASRFGSKDILEAIVDPSKVISDQYAALLVETRTENFLGLPAGEDEQTLTIYEDIFGEKKRSIPKADVLKREPAKVSLMPVGLLSPLHRDEVLDLLAYLSAGGRSDAPNFQPAP
jgi:putative heme-binding domain-containing protein